MWVYQHLIFIIGKMSITVNMIWMLSRY